MSGDWDISPGEQPEFDEIFEIAITIGIRNKEKKKVYISDVIYTTI